MTEPKKNGILLHNLAKDKALFLGSWTFVKLNVSLRTKLALYLPAMLKMDNSFLLTFTAQFIRRCASFFQANDRQQLRTTKITILIEGFTSISMLMIPQDNSPFHG